MPKKESNIIRHQLAHTQYKEHSAPLFMTSSFVFDDVEEMQATFLGAKERNIYSRFSNPNVAELVSKVCLLENAETGLATATGMAAIFATLASNLSAGDHVIASSALFGSTYKILEDILARWNIEHTYAAPDRLIEWEQAIRPTTKLIYIETPSNPLLKLVDIKALATIAKRHNILLVVDNCFATPIVQNPLDLGADLVIHSATKFLEGQGRALGGIIVGKESIIEPIKLFARQTGPAMSPFNAWLISKSLETLHVRMERHCSNAASIATFLDEQPQVSLVHYPFLPTFPQLALAQQQMRCGGALVSFELKGDVDDTRRFINAMTLFSNTSNLGDSRSIITHPSSSSLAKKSKEAREKVGVSDQLIRLSVGLENVEDLINDLRQALQKTFPR